jgi:fido (protein-threonine AMPylation protein)
LAGDPYVYPGRDVLRNRFGARDGAELARREGDATVLRLADLHNRRLAGNYDLPHLQAFHRHIFHDVYEWAGELRTVVREGNGRTQRAFFGQLTEDAGYRIAWDRLDPERNVKASRAAQRGDELPLRLMLAELREP